MKNTAKRLAALLLAAVMAFSLLPATAQAAPGVAWCVENGILKGKGENDLDPAAKVTRAEVAVMLDRFIALIK